MKLDTLKWCSYHAEVIATTETLREHQELRKCHIMNAREPIATRPMCKSEERCGKCVECHEEGFSR